VQAGLGAFSTAGRNSFRSPGVNVWNMGMYKDTKLSDIAAADAVGVFSDRSVAAVGTYEPVLSQVVSAHPELGAHILVSSKDYNDLILDIIMAHTGELKTHPDKYVKFLRAIYRAVDFFNAHQDQAIPIIAKQFSITPDDFKATE
jgi:NitT/TauT family transport system substrate-binding protein